MNSRLTKNPKQTLEQFLANFSFTSINDLEQALYSYSNEESLRVKLIDVDKYQQVLDTIFKTLHLKKLIVQRKSMCNKQNIAHLLGDAVAKCATITTLEFKGFWTNTSFTEFMKGLGSAPQITKLVTPRVSPIVLINLFEDTNNLSGLVEIKMKPSTKTPDICFVLDKRGINYNTEIHLIDKPISNLVLKRKKGNCKDEQPLSVNLPTSAVTIDQKDNILSDASIESKSKNKFNSVAPLRADMQFKLFNGQKSQIIQIITNKAHFAKGHSLKQTDNGWVNADTIFRKVFVITGRKTHSTVFKEWCCQANGIDNSFDGDRVYLRTVRTLSQKLGNHGGKFRRMNNIKREKIATEGSK